MFRAKNVQIKILTDIEFCSTFGIGGAKWRYAAKTAVITLQASVGGGLTGMSLSWYKNRQLEIGDVVNSVLGALVSITGNIKFHL